MENSTAVEIIDNGYSLKETDLLGLLIKKQDTDFDKFILPIVKSMKEIANFPQIMTAQNSEYNTKILERNYIISLAYVLGSLSCNLHEINNVINLCPIKVINGEVKKEFECNHKEKDDICKIYNISHPKSKSVIDNITFIPDLLIHESNDPNVTQNEFQHLVLEAKTTSHLSQYQFAWDFCKLNLYQKYLNFRNAVYLIVNTDFKKIKKHLGQYLKDYPNTISKKGKMYFLIQEDINGDVEIWEFINSNRINYDY